MKPTLVVLAAGLSTRYGRLKQLEPLGPGGEALLDYAVFDAWKSGFARLLLVVREELEEAFRDHMRGRWPPEMEVVFHHQRLADLPGWPGVPHPSGGDPAFLASRVKPWGTAHALLTAREQLAGPFLVLNADDFYGPSAFAQAASLLEGKLIPNPGEPPIFALVAYTLQDTLSLHGGVSRGLCQVDPRGWLVGVEEVLGVQAGGGGILGRTVGGEQMLLSGREPVSTNFWIFTPEIFPSLLEGFREFLEGVARGSEAGAPGRPEPEFLLPAEVNRLLASGKARVRVARAKDAFLGITHPPDRDWVVEGLARFAREGRYPNPLWGR